MAQLSSILLFGRSSNFIDVKFLHSKLHIFFIKSAAEDYLEAIQDFKYLSDFFKKIEEGKDICDDFNENIYFNKNNEENIKESKIDLNDFYIQWIKQWKFISNRIYNIKFYLL